MPLRIEVVAYAPTAFFHCTHCEVVWQETGFSAGLRREQAATGLPPDLLDEYQRLSDWVHHLMATYCDRVIIQVIDALSLQGVWKTVRHRLGRYPAVILPGGTCFTSLDTAEAAVAEAMLAAER